MYRLAILIVMNLFTSINAAIWFPLIMGQGIRQWRYVFAYVLAFLVLSTFGQLAAVVGANMDAIKAARHD